MPLPLRRDTERADKVTAKDMYFFMLDRNGLSETICLHLDVEYEDADDKNCVGTFNCQLPAAGKLKAGCYCRAKSLALAIGPFHHFHQ